MRKIKTRSKAGPINIFSSPRSEERITIMYLDLPTNYKTNFFIEKKNSMKKINLFFQHFKTDFFKDIKLRGKNDKPPIKGGISLTKIYSVPPRAIIYLQDFLQILQDIFAHNRGKNVMTKINSFYNFFKDIKLNRGNDKPPIKGGVPLTYIARPEANISLQDFLQILQDIFAHNEGKFI